VSQPQRFLAGQLNHKLHPLGKVVFNHAGYPLYVRLI
jgi:hypothetical protein